MLNVGIIFGSRSCEHEVSIITALQLIKNIDKNKYKVFPIYISKQGVWYTGDALLNLKTYMDFDPFDKGIVKVNFDISPGSGALISKTLKKGIFGRQDDNLLVNLDCIIPIIHGRHGEDGTLQGLLELSDIPYASSGVLASSIGMDKHAMKIYFKGLGFPILDFYAISSIDWDNKNDIIMDIESKFKYPLIVKPSSLGSSIGVSKANNKEELIDAIELALSFDIKVLVEPAIENPIELNCSVLGDSRFCEASVIEMPVTGGNVLSFVEKYMSSGASKGMASLKRIVPAPIEEDLEKELKNLSVRVFKGMECKGVARIDYMLDPNTNKYYITEINTIPGSMAFYLWEKSGISYKELIDKLIDIAFFEHKRKDNLNYIFSSNILQSNSSGKLGTKGSKF